MLTNPGNPYINDGNLFKCKNCSGYKLDTYLCISLSILFY